MSDVFVCLCVCVSLPWLSQDGVNVLSAVVGDVSGSVWLCPSEVIKQQMQSANDGARVGLGEAVKACWQGAGIGGFYQGYAGTHTYIQEGNHNAQHIQRRRIGGHGQD